MSGGITLLDKWHLLRAIMADRALLVWAKSAAFALLAAHVSRTGLCFPSYATLATMIGTDRRATAVDACRELEVAGSIALERGHGRSHSNQVTFAFERKWQPPKKASADPGKR